MAVEWVLAPNVVDPSHLRRVVQEMRKKGPPTIRAYWDGEFWRALEGSHRLAAAKVLDLPVFIQEMEWDDEMSHDFPDIQDNPATVGEIVEYIEDSREIDAYEIVLV